MDRDGGMTDSRPVDFAAVLANLVQQQTALLRAHSESVQLQRLLVERLLGNSTVVDTTGSVERREPDERTDASAMLNALPAIPIPPGVRGAR
jgi:hypothetical protein